MLTALKEGLREYGQGGESHLSLRLEGLRLRIEKIIEETELGFLYDREAQLFHIGYSVSDGTFSKSYYDLLMSEARMTGYYAVAKRIVPKKHMESLSRIMSRSGRHVGPLSWTGTMFEFFLPHLLLPVYEGSMSEHALRYCEYCQKKRADGMGIPFGMSESGFYSFDRELNYQYKAHGAQKLALKPTGISSCLLIPRFYCCHWTRSRRFQISKSFPVWAWRVNTDFMRRWILHRTGPESRIIWRYEAIWLTTSG